MADPAVAGFRRWRDLAVAGPRRCGPRGGAPRGGGTLGGGAPCIYPPAEHAVSKASSEAGRFSRLPAALYFFELCG